ncbi:beta-ketoacyl synthase N-terminal-like domain-containing protein [Ornithinibacillus scapharcae]|uniref:beta-ketoacyl synthase N-terminal-like domain-containing protein n=1 Tax=Ornithinibacillus scapharcae TaxID=1147159 RepID=UPI000225B03B|nr:beta-ketoacyl synthase N-terminal-like domain-containing protein [Ornithinibacillus scapharcae]
MNNQGVAITGYGIVCSIGHNSEEFTEALRTGKSGVSQLKDSRTGLGVNIGAEIKDFSLRNYLLDANFSIDMINRVKKMTRRAPLMMETVVAAALQAMECAGLSLEQPPTSRTSIIVAGSNLSQNLNFNTAERHFDNLEFVSPNYALQFFDTNIMATLSELFNIHGEGYTVGGASASGNSALLQAYRLIKTGYADQCLVAGPMSDLSPIELQSFYNLGALGGNGVKDPKAACRPFDADHDGFIYGQGSGCLILESIQSAKNRGADILAELAGGAMILDGNRLSDARESGEVAVMKKALLESNISISDIDYINAHATSTPLGDEIEARSIKSVFKNEINRIWINSTKSMTGHCLTSAGIIELIACIEQMKNGFIHPNLNLENPIDPDLRFAGSHSINVEIDTVMSNSFGFGGINTSIILRKSDH